MQKNVVLTSTAILFTLALTALTNEGLIYVSATLMAFTVIVALRYFRPGIKITRWAKANPRKAQMFITVLQMLILSFGLIVGYDLKQLGYTLSDTPGLVFASLMLIGFLSVRFFRKRDLVAIPVNLYRDRVAYTGIIVAAYAMTVIVGNRIEDKYPRSILADVLRTIDAKIFLQGVAIDEEQQSPIYADNLVATSQAPPYSAFPSLIGDEKVSNEFPVSKEEPKLSIKPGKKVEKLEKMQKRMKKRIEKWRKAFAEGATAGTVLLMILLILALCAGVCLIVAGFSGGGAVPVIFGVVVTGGAIWGIVELTKKKKANKQKPSQ